MGEGSKMYEDTRELVEKAKKKLEGKELLTKEETSVLSTAIANLPDKEIVSEITREGEKNLNIDVLFEDFNNYADQSKGKLEGILDIISQGRIPSLTERDELNNAIKLLCDKYESVKSLALSELAEDEIPAEGSDISTYYEALKNSKSAVMRGKIKEIEKTLERFISVQSLIAKYTLALEPLQKEAKSLLDRINNGDVTDMDEISEGVEAPELFMKALDCDDLNTDEGNDMLDSLIDDYSYPLYVTRGLLSKSYFVPENPEETVVEEETDKVKANNTVIESSEEEAASAEIAPETYSEDIHNEDTEVSSEESKEEALPISEEPEKEHTEFRKAIEEKEIALEDSEFGILSKEISTAETKKLSASVFSNDMRKGNVKALKSIIQQLSNFMILSPELMKMRFNMPTDVAEASLDFLQKKGYIRKYRIMPGGEFYCSSPRLEKSLTYKDAAKFAGVRQLHADTMGELIEDTSSSASARMTLLKLYTNTALNHIESDIKQSSSNNMVMTEAFAYRTYDSANQDDVEFLAGAFWTNYNEADDFAENIKKLIDESKNIISFVFAAINKEIAKTIMGEIVKMAPEKFTKNIYLYSAKDEKYYSFETDAEVNIEDIWTYLADADEEVSEVEEKENTESTEEIAASIEEEPATENEKKVVATKKAVEPPKVITTVDNNQDKNSIIHNFFIGRKYYCAPAYARALAIKDASWSELYDRIAYAVNDPMRRCIYSADSVFDLVSNTQNAFDDDLMVAVGIRTFFSNQVRYDFNIKAFYNAIKEYAVLSDYPALSNVLYKLVEFKDTQKKGMDAYADYRAKSKAQLEEEVKGVQQEAKIFYESTILAKKQERSSQRRFLETKKLLFNVNSDIGQYIKVVVDDEKDMQSLVAEFIQKNFIKEGNTLSEDSIDADLLWDFILKYWDEAGEKMMMKLRADLMSRLRSNIVSITTKAIQIMIHWCNLVEKFNDQTEDDGAIAYRKIRKPLLEDINESLKEITDDKLQELTSAEEKAGLEAIRYALSDVLRCIEGTYDENEKKYFYAPFLFTDDVLLDESFCPDLDIHSAEVAELQPENRIVNHANKELDKPEDRLKSILEDGGDDYGVARLIVEYLRAMKLETSVASYSATIDASEEYAKETADLKKEQFIGELELAQSYGQIDNSNSSEDKKEKILQIVDAWYEAAVDSSNYGFFEKVMESYIAEIRRESKSREKDLLEQLDAFKGTSIKGISTEAKEKKIAKIQSAIEQQNYTVAEDLLARADQPDAEHEDVIEENFLKEFLDDYNDYYKSVAMSQTSFATLVSNRTRNKEERGGKRLADNWLPGGSKLGKDRLIALLNGFGFKVDSSSVQEQSQIVRFENYNVRTIKATNGKREIYTHPIAAFGSGASEEGFRVVCINGKYDAAGLIDLMKQIGNAKHTMILLDCALDKPERRILARKSKTELGDKLFVVVDRTVMMYMVKNYDETKAKRMLMSLIVPFGYYQPYVWESSNVMPPEIFMGRKHELERIESPTGANIVYGGRQLGKSALLKKAKADIDKDENGDRAVLVEIKGLNYEAAAKKIGHALYDEGVLTEDITTTDWDDLSRAIRKRLQSDKNRIQYLLLLLDEADAFIESCEKINYQPFDALKEIQSIGAGRFKFVIAGLRNIVRFKRDAALGNNSVLTHLEAMTVKPFQPAEARELMEIPLHYLGLEFPKENESLMTLILATTNYFPGLIQMYCAKLLTAMRSKDYAGYDEADTPVYEISEDHIKKVLADSEFTDQIREKFFITLKLDEDNYYYLIALIMAYLYHGNGYNEGYSASDIKEAGKTLDISKIAGLDDDKLIAFMEELKELNVLRSTDDTHYLFSKFSFFQMMGTSTEVDDKLVEYMEV